MNKVILIGRLTKEPEVRYSQTAQGNMAIARFSLAVDRKGKDAGTDFINCVAFGKNGEFAEKYVKKGTKIAVEGRIQTGSYEKDGRKVYTTDVVVEGFDFCESKGQETPKSQEAPKPSTDEWLNIPDGIDGELPFN